MKYFLGANQLQVHAFENGGLSEQFFVLVE